MYCFFFNDTATTEIYTLSLHDALPIYTTYHFRAKAVDHGPTVYGVDLIFTIPEQPPVSPPNINPIAGARCVTLPVTLQSAPFSDTDPGDTHSASQWQVRLANGTYTSPVYDSGIDAVNLTSLTVTAGVLDHSADYYWHVKHQDNRGLWSEWSMETLFMTADTRVGMPVTVNPDSTEVTFDEVLVDGCTSVRRSDTTPAGHTDPGWWRLGPFVDITTTAMYGGTITVGLPYPDPGGYGYESGYNGLAIYHWNGMGWEEVTTWIDSANSVIYGEVSSLSWFYIGGQQWYARSEDAPVFPTIYVGIGGAFAAVLAAYFIRRKLVFLEE